MRKGCIAIFFALLLFSCRNNEQNELEPQCRFHEELYPPDGFSIVELGEIDFDGELETFQFLNDSIGFALLDQPTEYTQVFKTVDGGQNWVSLGEGIEDFSRDLYFVNENIGIVATQYPRIFITNDGGDNWGKNELGDSDGGFHKLISNGEDLIFGLRFGRVSKSEDYGTSWEVIYDNEGSENQIGPPFFQIKNDLILVGSNAGDIFKMDFQGEIVDVIQTQMPHIRQACFFDEDIIIVSSLNEIVKSENGGGTFFSLSNRANVFMDFESRNEGILLSGANHCNMAAPFSAGLFINTSSGGEQWNEHFDLTTGLLNDFKGAYKTTSDSYYFFVDKKQYEIIKM